MHCGSEPLVWKLLGRNQEAAKLWRWNGKRVRPHFRVCRGRPWGARTIIWGIRHRCYHLPRTPRLKNWASSQGHIPCESNQTEGVRGALLLDTAPVLPSARTEAASLKAVRRFFFFLLSAQPGPGTGSSMLDAGFSVAGYLWRPKEDGLGQKTFSDSCLAHDFQDFSQHPIISI